MHKNASERMKTSTTNPLTLSYWINLYDGDEIKAKDAHSKAQTRDLAYFVEKYGEQKGKEKHQNKVDSWMYSFFNKTEEEMQDILKRQINNSYKSNSNLEKEIFKQLKEIFPNIESQLVIKKTTGKGRYVYDCYLGKKIIEIYGDFWHMNPKVYEPDSINTILKMCAKDRWIMDEKRNQLAIETGHQIMVIWEYDYRENKQREIDKCITFLRQ